MKKKIIFMVINMNIGGTEKALLNMISEMPKEKFDITVLMLEKYGGFLNTIPDHVHVKYFDGYTVIKDIINSPPRLIFFKYLKKGKIITVFNLLILFLVTKIMNERRILFRYLIHGIPKMKNEYDVAIAYAGPMDFISYFVVHKIKAKKKVQWIHFDVTKIGFNKNFASKVYKMFDQIFVVSQEAKHKLTQFLPNLHEKTDVFHNIVPIKEINNKSNEKGGFQDNFNGIRILTVGRLSHEKGQDLAIKALAKLVDEGYNVKWYCLGEGKAKREYERLIDEYNVNGRFILLGANPNPYTYMKQCDIYVQPSRYEGYCLTLIEAKSFNKPIITTKVNGVNEQISHAKTGIIVDFDVNQLYIAIKSLLDNKSLKQSFEKNLQNEKDEKSNEINKFFKLVEGHN